MYYLRSKKIVFFCFLFFIVFTCNSQYELYNTDHDRSKFFVGISLGLQTSELILRSNKPANVFSFQPIAKGSLSVGLLATKKINDNFQFRINPQLLISADRSFTYSINGKEPTIQNLASTILNVPFHIKLQSNRDVNFRSYIFAGPKFDYDFSQISDERKNIDLIQLKGFNWGYEIGIGLTFYLPFMTLSPEIKFSNGLYDIYGSKANTEILGNVQSIQTKLFLFSLIFED